MSSETPGTTAAITLHPDDLIDDRELAATTEDRLAHEGIVDQLAALATSVKTPSNIALYGPWGSGKSGIANLLKAKIDGKGGVRCVRFDAFKYADIPLRRNFISAVATELKCTNSKYHDDLYSGRTKTDISVPPATIWKLLWVFALLLVGLSVIIGVVVAVAAFVQSRVGDNTAFGHELRGLSDQVVVAGLLPAALLAALISLASKTFSVDRSISRPESDEQFEALFRQLVDDSGAKRLVVFVDELDRCTADEVVATLDTVRTFLGMEGCVFIIAADQNVLEEALTRAAKQETPANDANPYYSTGSAYLDKVFQYQLSLPPLLTQSISNYATTLVHGRGGLWGEINTEYVLSVLIPTHVTSPRRVKHLLNAFALTYRLAQERHQVGWLAEDPCPNAPSIARLACLRIEFPLFARHLEIAPSLPNLVLQLVRNKNAALPSGTSARAIELAKSYALENAAPGAVLVSDDPKDDNDDGAERTLVAHNKQLLNYLSRTRQVKGPSRDLIYMQSTGTVFGLDGDLALAIERAAEDADIATLQQRIEGLDEDSRIGVLQLLADQIRSGTGVSGPNAARSFLLITENNPGLPVSSVVDAVVEAICVAQDEAGGVLDEETVTSAWALAKAGSEASANALRQRILNIVTGTDWTPPDFVFDDAVVALDAAPDLMPKYLAARLVDDTGPDTVAHLFRLADDDLLPVISTLRPQVVELAQEAVSAHAAWTKAQEIPATTAPAVTQAAATATGATPDDEEAEQPFNPKALFDALAGAALPRETPTQHRVLALLLSVNAKDARSAAFSLIGATEPTDDTQLAASILRATRHRALQSWPSWLAGVKTSAITSAHVQPLTSLVANVWNNGDVDQTRTALDALAPFIAALPVDRKPDLTADVLEKVEPWVETNEMATVRREVLDRARLFATAGVLNYRALMNAVVRTLQDALARQVTVVGPGEPLYDYVTRDGTEAIAACSDTLTADDLHGILSEASESPWLNDLGHVEVPLELARSAGHGLVAVSNLPASVDVAEAAHNHGAAATHAATLWVELAQPSPDELAAVYEPLLVEMALNDELADAVQRAQAAWTVEQQRGFLDRYLSAPDTEVPSDLALKVIGLARVDDAAVADLLCQRFETASNNAQRQSVIALWAKAEIESDPARRKLVETVVYGLLDIHASTASGNVGAAEMALNALNTVGNPLPTRLKGALGQRVKTAVTGNKSLESKALDILPGLGYSTAKGFFGRPRGVNFDDN